MWNYRAGALVSVGGEESGALGSLLSKGKANLSSPDTGMTSDFAPLLANSDSRAESTGGSRRADLKNIVACFWGIPDVSPGWS